MADSSKSPYTEMVSEKITRQVRVPETTIIAREIQIGPGGQTIQR